MADSTAYCTPADLLTGDLVIGQTVNRQEYVDRAAEEMDAKLGWLYATPILVDGDPGHTPDPIPALPRHEALLLKTINAKIATAWLIMSLSINEEGSMVHAYALRLLKEGNDELLLLANGDLTLHAPRVETDPIAIANRTPGVINVDSESLLDPFYNVTNWGLPWTVDIGADPRG